MQRVLMCLLLLLSPCLLHAEGNKISLHLKWKHEFQFAGYYMALEKGYYRDAGLDVSLIEGGSEQNAVQYVLEHQHAYAVTDTGALLARAHGEPIKALGAIFQHSPLALMVLKDSGINNLKDLHGKRIMLQNGYQSADILALLKEVASLSKQDFTLQKSSFDIQDLIQGKTDAFSIYTTDQPRQLDELGIAYRIFRPSDHGIDYYGDILITSEQEIKDDPGRVDAFMTATRKGWLYALAHTGETIDLIYLKYNSQHLSRQQFQFEARETAKLVMADVIDIGYMNVYRWQRIADIYADQGFMSADYPVESFLYHPQPSVLTVVKEHVWGFSLLVLLLVLLFSAMLIFTLRKRIASGAVKLAESEKNLRHLIALADVGLLVHRQGRVIFANHYVLELLQMASLDELLGRMLLQYVHPDDRGDVEARIQQMIQHGTTFHRISIRQISETGEQHDVEFSAMPIQYEGELSVMTVLLDVTERKRAEQSEKQLQRQVEHAQRLESLGVLAGGIAHDFNNLLTVILGHAGMAVGHMKRDPVVLTRHLQQIIQSADSAALLCKQMLAYSGKGHFIVEPLDISQMLKDMTELLEVSIEKVVRIIYRMPERLPLVEADAAQLQQVIMNLVINASEAIGEQGGEIEISSGTMQVDRLYLEHCLHEQAESGSFVYVEVADDGCGMDAATQEKIFDPFFTTKFTGRGLGMSAMLGIVRGHHGAIHLDSAAGQGTRIRVLFPSLGRYASDAADAGGVVAAHAPFKGCVLVVDDEPDVLEMAVLMLEDFGFQTLTAVNGREAVDIYRQQMDQGNEIRFVLLDLTMPVMGGEEAVAALRQINSDVQVIISSGYAEEDVRDRFKAHTLAGFIQKPYMPMMFEQLLERVL